MENDIKTTSNKVISAEVPPLAKKILKTLSLLAVATALFLFWKGYDAGGFWYWAGGLFSLLVALVLLGSAEPGNKASCPSCGNEIRTNDQKIQKCSQCHCYVEYKKSEIISLDKDTILEEPLFEASLPERFYWPNGCCICGKKATKLEELAIEKSQTGRNIALGVAGLAVGALIVRTGGGYNITLQVPHCDLHSAGIKMKDAKSILFRSYRYYLDFCSINEIGETKSAPDEDINKAVKNIMILVMLADGVIEEEEKSSITYIYEKISGSPYPMEELSEDINTHLKDEMGFLDYVKELNENQSDMGKRLIYKSALMVALADGNCSVEEEKLLAEIVLQLNISDAIIQSVYAEFS